jgi:hypothetical protein
MTTSVRQPDAGPRRVAGFAAVTAGALLATSQLAGLTLDRDPAHLAEVSTSPLGTAYVLTKLGAYLLLPLVLLGIHAVQSHRTGRLGAVGLAMAWIGTLLTLGDWWFEAFAVPWLAATSPDVVSTAPGRAMVVAALAGFALQSAGWVLLGVAGVRAAVLPRWAAVLMIVGGAVGLGAGYPPFLLPLAVAVVGIGVVLLRGERHPVAGHRPPADRPIM